MPSGLWPPYKIFVLFDDINLILCKKTFYITRILSIYSLDKTTQRFFTDHKLPSDRFLAALPVVGASKRSMNIPEIFLIIERLV